MIVSGVVEAATLGVMLSAVAWLVSRFKLPHTELAGPFMALLVAALASTVRSVAPGASLGRLVILSGGIACYYVAVTQWKTARIAAYAMLLALLVEILSGARRPGGLLHNPNSAASALLLVSWVSWPASLVPLPLLSRGATLAALAAELWTRRSRQSRRLVLWGAVALVVLAVGLCLLRTGTVEKRLGTWAEAGALFLARPLLGWGPGAYRVLARVEPGHVHADSLPLTVAAEGGLVGLLAWGWLVVVVARRARGVQAPGLLAWGLHQLVDCTAFFPVVLVLLSISLAGVTDESDIWTEEREPGAVQESPKVAESTGDSARVRGAGTVRAQ